MNLYFDVDARRFISAPGTRDIVSVLDFKRGDTLPVAVRFVSGTVVVEIDPSPATAATGRLAMKPVGSFDVEPTAGAASWVKTGTGTSTYYTFDLLLNTEDLNTLLGVGEAADVSSVQLNFEMEYILEDGSVISSNTILATVYNDVNRDEDNTPINLPDADDWLTARAVRFDEAQTLSNAQKAQAAANLGFATYATLELANTGLAEIGTPFWDTTLHKYRATTDIA